MANGTRRAPQLTTALLGGFLAVLGVIGVLLGTDNAAQPQSIHLAAAMAVALLFIAAEVTQFHVEVRRQALSVSISDLPLILGLFLLPFPWVLAARIAAALFVFAIRRPAAVKASFNLGLFTFEVGLGAILFRFLDAGDGLDVTDWLAGYATALSVDVLGTAAVVCAMAVLQGMPNRRSIGQMTASVVMSGMIATTLALMSVIVLRTSPWGIVLLGILAAVLSLAHRAYYALLRRHTDVGQLFSFTQTVETADSSDDMVNSLLTQARDLLQAETAVLRLQPELEGPQLVPAGEPLLIERNPRDPLMRHWLAQAGLRDAMVVPVRDGNQVIGVLQVGNRLGEASTFSRDDLRLLQTLVAHAEVIWHNGRLLDQLRHDAHHDGVTGLGNRARFHNRLASRLSELPVLAPSHSQRRGQQLPPPDNEKCLAAVLLLDLDRFREVNDALGHGVGDVLLRQVAARLLAHVPPEATVARLGGDEFAVLLPHCTSAADALHAADIARTGLTGPFEVQGTFLEVGASVGVALVPQDGHDADTVLKHADVAMYSAKRSSHGIARYRRSDDTSSRHRLALAGELRRAMDDGQIDLYFQPQVSMDTGRVIGFEALARWQHPDRGMVMPDVFIPLAEQTGLIGRLTHIALRQALEETSSWLSLAKTRDEPFAIAVNLSPRRLLEPDLPTVVDGLLAGAGVPAHLLTLEITESSLMTDPDAARRALHELREIGVRLSVDDFGTGYSALAYLQRLPLDEVKIDKSFVIPMMTDSGARAIVRAIVELAHTLDLTVVAEGVEHETARDSLQTMGCDVMQGYFIARPLMRRQIEPWLADWERRNPVPTHEPTRLHRP